MALRRQDFIVGTVCVALIAGASWTVHSINTFSFNSIPSAPVRVYPVVSYIPCDHVVVEPIRIDSVTLRVKTESFTPNTYKVLDVRSGNLFTLVEVGPCRS